MQDSGASGISVEAMSGAAQFNLRTPEAITHFRQGELSLEQIAVSMSLGWSADCTLGALPCEDPSC
eukprot:8895354-Alexandrium_andersonii.AAC.1